MTEVFPAPPPLPLKVVASILEAGDLEKAIAEEEAVSVIESTDFSLESGRMAAKEQGLQQWRASLDTRRLTLEAEARSLRAAIDGIKADTSLADAMREQDAQAAACTAEAERLERTAAQATGDVMRLAEQLGAARAKAFARVGEMKAALEAADGTRREKDHEGRAADAQIADARSRRDACSGELDFLTRLIVDRRRLG